MQIATPFLRQQTLQAHFHQSIHRIGKGRVQAEGEKAHATAFAQLRILLLQHRNLRTDGMQVGLEQLHSDWASSCAKASGMGRYSNGRVAQASASVAP